MSAARQLASNPLLLNRIFSEFYPFDGDENLAKINKRRLLHLALTCRAFKGPALDVLWYCLEYFVHLVKTIPNLQVIKNTYVNHISFLISLALTLFKYLCGAIPADSPFRQYASRVRVLNLLGHPEGVPKISPHLAVLIAQDMHGNLFPAVRNLSLNITGNSTEAKDYLTLLPLFFSSRVQAITFTGWGLRCGLFANYCLPLLSQRCSSLTSLKIASPLNISGAGLRPITEIPNLRSLDLSMCDGHGLKSDYLPEILRPLQSLDSLTLDVHFYKHRDADGLNLRTAASLGLAHLQIKVLTLVSYNHESGGLCRCTPLYLLERTTSQANLVLRHLVIDRPDIFNNAIQPIMRNPGLNTLAVRGYGKTTVTNVESLQPFGALSISRLIIQLPFAPDHPQPLLYHFAEQALLINIYPVGNISQLVFPAQKAQRGKGATVHCLHRISAATCGLNSLFVTLDPSFDELVEPYFAGYSSQTKEPSGPKGNRTSSSLQHLYIMDPRGAVAGMTMDHGRKVAKLLDYMFPALVAVHPYDKGHAQLPYWKDHWALIEGLRKMCQATRLQQG